jgi:hypothetical protein
VQLQQIFDTASPLTEVQRKRNVDGQHQAGVTAADTAAKCRVEDGRGCLGPSSIAPFPIPAHQTGRASASPSLLFAPLPQGEPSGHLWKEFYSPNMKAEGSDLDAATSPISFRCPLTSI